MNDFLMPNVIHYFPPHIANIEEFKRIAKVYDAQLKQIWIALDQMEDNRHFDSMEASECTYWEKIMQIKLTGEETLEDRRRNLKGRWVSSRPYTAKKFKEVLDAMVGEQYYKLEINPKEKMKNLTVGKQQMCEIAKAISHKAEVIIFDEPSAALTEKEIADLFEIIRDLRKKNLGIVYISHRMDEIKTITDRVTVMRDGGYVGTLITKDSTKEDIINMMVGRVIYEDPKQESAVPADAPVVLKVEHLNAGKMVQDVSFELKKGEILGFSGLMGAGRTETARALFGADPKQSGKISVMGKDGQLHEVTINSPQDAVKYGIGYLSEDRRRYGCVVQKSVTENTTLATMEEFTNGIFINKAKEKKVAEKYVNELATKTPTTDQLVVNLSGGNQQKVVIAKWLTRDSDILIFDEPTRGIDVGAKNEIYKLMNRLAAEGKSIIMISSEMTEVLRMSDRIIIMCEGKVTGCIDISEATQENIMDKATRNID